MKLHIKSLNYSTISTIFLIVILTIWSELSKPFKTFLASITGHHWASKGLFSLVFFVIVYSTLSKISKKESDVKKETYYVIGATVFGGLIIFLFYIWHFFS